MAEDGGGPVGLVGGLAVGEGQDGLTDEIDRLPSADVVILLAAGPRGVHDDAVARGGDVPVELPIASDILPAITRLLQYPLVRGNELPEALARLATAVLWTRPHLAMVPVTVPATIDHDVAAVLGSALHEALAESGVAGLLVACVAAGTAPAVAFRAACEAAQLEIVAATDTEPAGPGVLRATATRATGQARRFDRTDGERRDGVLPRTGDPRG